jgi:hypothetical protein
MIVVCQSLIAEGHRGGVGHYDRRAVRYKSHFCGLQLTVVFGGQRP